MGEPAPHPGEGTKVGIEAPAIGEEPATPVVPPPAGAPLPPRPQVDPEAPWPVIGGSPTPPHLRREREPAAFVPPVPPRRYVPPEGEPAPKAMPKVYGRSPLLAYWYVPVAVLLAIGVALGVIWTSDQLFSSSESSQQPAAATTTAPPPSVAATPSPASASATAVTSPTAAVSPTPTRGSGTSTKFQPGMVAIVTGAGDCLNVRTNPGRNNDAIICLKDGEEVTVTGGPELSGDLQWWKVKTKLGEGWAAEDYLVKK